MADKLPKLADLFDAEKETVTGNLARDRGPELAVSTMQKTLDRVLYRYTELCPDRAVCTQAQSILQGIKNTLPLMMAVNDSRHWELKEGSDGKRKPPLVGILLSAVGLALVVAGTLLADYVGDHTFSLSNLLLPTVGAVCLLLGGIFIIKKPRLASSQSNTGKVEYLIEPALVFQTVRGALLAADKALEDARDRAEAERVRSDESGASPISSEETELFASLLEAAYARRGANDSDAKEVEANIRYYLHRRGVELEDYTRGHESWFELLPARKPGTMRPAMVAGGRLVKKGLASDKGT